MKTCLIVDDSRMIRRVAGRIVRDLGFETTDAINGRDALDKCLIEMPDAILVDWAMPVMDGFDFVKNLRSLPGGEEPTICLLYTSPSPRDATLSRMPSSA